MTYPQQPYGQVGGPQRPHYPGTTPAPGPGGWQPPPAMPPPGLSLGDAAKRLVGWGGMVVSPRERIALTGVGIWEERLQHLLVWRRSVLLVILPALVLTLVMSFYTQIQSTADGIYADYTDFGVLLTWLPVVTSVALPIGATIAVFRWTDLRWSVRVLFWSWLIATVVPLCTMLFPLEWMIDLQGMMEAEVTSVYGGYTEEMVDFFLELGMMNVALISAVFLLPIIIGLAGGVLRGARRTKSLFPAAVLPGWFVVVVAPFCTIVMLSVFAVLSPVFGSGELTAGVFLLALAPLVYLVYRGRYTKPMTRMEASSSLSRVSLTSLAISLLGMVCIAIFLATGSAQGKDILGASGFADDGDAWFSYFQIVEFGVDLFARFHLTSVVMCFLFASMMHREWRNSATMSEPVRREYEGAMQSLFQLNDSPAPAQHFASQGPQQPAPQQPASQGWQPPAAPTPGWPQPNPPRQSQPR